MALYLADWPFTSSPKPSCPACNFHMPRAPVRLLALSSSINTCSSIPQSPGELILSTQQIHSILFFLFRATPTAYGGSQTRGPIRATAAGLRPSRCQVSLQEAVERYGCHIGSGLRFPEFETLILRKHNLLKPQFFLNVIDTTIVYKKHKQQRSIAKHRKYIAIIW